jgi:Raf kinase inhibitor-like YbhB/YbcL family protein
MGLNIKDLAVSSPDFADGDRLDDRFAYDKGNAQPTLTISGVPDGTVELAVICHDPDAPLPDGFTHWTLYGIAPDTTSIAAGGSAGRAGPNEFGGTGYGGPMPPAGHGSHHYYFWVFALDRAVEGEPSRREFIDSYGDAIIEQNRTIGTYSN